jgi:predicted negative regulator of RcsB-dependent stress response
MLDKAIKVNPRLAAPYMQYGDIYKYYWGGHNALDSARYYYQKAINCEPKNPQPYRKMVDLLMFRYKLYANKQTHVDTLKMQHMADSATTVLAELKRQNPEYPAELLMGDIYSKAGKIQKSSEAYAKVKDLLDAPQYNSYAVNYLLQGQYDESLRLALEGIEKFPDYPQFNRTIMYCQAELKHYDEALAAYKTLQQRSDSLVSLDYWYAGNIYMEKGDYKAATLVFNNIYDTSDDMAAKHLNKVTPQFQRVTGGMKADGNYEKAAEIYKIYVDNKRKKTAYDYYVLAEIWKDMATDQTVETERRHYAAQKADSIYAVCQQTDADYETDLIYYWRGVCLWQIDADEKMENGRALPHFAKLIEYYKGNSNAVSRKNRLLSSAYHYMVSYNVQHDNFRAAADYAMKYKSLNPDDTTFDTVINYYNKKR